MAIAAEQAVPPAAGGQRHGAGGGSVLAFATGGGRAGDGEVEGGIAALVDGEFGLRERGAGGRDVARGVGAERVGADVERVDGFGGEGQILERLTVFERDVGDRPGAQLVGVG